MNQKPNVKIKEDVNLIEIDEITEKLELMITNKTPLKNIIKSVSLYEKINESVLLVNKIIIQTCQFINLYLIHLYENNKEFPKITTKFVMAVVKTITIRNDTRGKPPSEDTKELLI